jgi:hypothetical protein
MENARYIELTNNLELKLSNEEVDLGWHFCNEWDGLLIHKTWPEHECCICTFIEEPPQKNRKLISGIGSLFIGDAFVFAEEAKITSVCFTETMAQEFEFKYYDTEFTGNIIHTPEDKGFSKKTNNHPFAKFQKSNDKGRKRNK